MLEKFEATMPCPVCGSMAILVTDMNRIAFTDNLSEAKLAELAGLYAARCEGIGDERGYGCGAMGPAFQTKEAAISWWEDRKYEKTKKDFTIGGLNNELGNQ